MAEESPSPVCEKMDILVVTEDTSPPVPDPIADAIKEPAKAKVVATAVSLRAQSAKRILLGPAVLRQIGMIFRKASISIRDKQSSKAKGGR